MYKPEVNHKKCENPIKPNNCRKLEKTRNFTSFLKNGKNRQIRSQINFFSPYKPSLNIFTSEKIQKNENMIIPENCRKIRD